MIKGVSFDAAGTLLVNRYHPGKFARDCANSCGIAVTDPEEAAYVRIFKDRLAAFWTANQTRSEAALRDYWLDLTRDWLAEIGEDTNCAKAICAEGERQLLESDSWFEPYDDVEPAINLLVSLDLPVFVLSNWDLSLHRILRAKIPNHSFALTIASLEEGYEKPDPRIFHVLCARANLAPDEIIHIGDSWGDDVEGALCAGIHAGFVDRTINQVASREMAGDRMLIRGATLPAIIEAALCS
ncbi:MAG: HAD-IA family hydrolase [Chthonomonas sp.]|nr:HAD-IA family hydrolase [Chthonomonas sp.]